jgi:hypothetical protein
MRSVEGLPLSGSTVVYYFTYGSVLSGLHRQGDEKCDRALGIFSQLRERYAEDPTIMSIVRDGEEICIYSTLPVEGAEEAGSTDALLEEPTPEP